MKRVNERQNGLLLTPIQHGTRQKCCCAAAAVTNAAAAAATTAAAAAAGAGALHVRCSYVHRHV